MAVEQQATALLAWLGTYFVHSTLLLVAAWTLARLVSSSRRLADAAPAIREGVWRVALLAALVTATVQRGFDVEGNASLWTIETTTAAAAAPESAAVAPPRLDVPLETRPQVPPSADQTALGLPRIVPMILPAHIALIPVVEPRAADRSATEAELVASPGAAAAPITRTATKPAAERELALSWPRVLLTLWLLGVAIGGVHWTREWLFLRRRLRGRVVLDRGPVHDVFARLCERTGTTNVRLTCAPALGAPITLGLWNAEVVIPPRATTQLSPDELEALFAHELAHVNRADPLWLVVYRALEVVFFFQPLNRIARVRLVDEAELLADDWAATQLESRVSLASCLTEIAGWIVSERRALPAPAMAARGTRLAVRVRRLLDEEHHPENARRPSGLLLLAGLAVTGVALFGPGVAAERPEPPLEIVVEPPAAAQPIERHFAVDAVTAEGLANDTGASSTTPEAASLVTTESSSKVHGGSELDALRLELAALRSVVEGRADRDAIERELEALELELALIEGESAELALLLAQLLALTPAIDEAP